MLPVVLKPKLGQFWALLSFNWSDPGTRSGLLLRTKSPHAVPDLGLASPDNSWDSHLILYSKVNFN